MKKLVYFVLAIVAITSVFSACDNENSYLVARVSKTARYGKDTVVCYVYTSNGKYNVHSDATWCVVRGESFKHDSFYCYIDSNTTKEERIAPVQVNDGKYAVTLYVAQEENPLVEE